MCRRSSSMAPRIRCSRSGTERHSPRRSPVQGWWGGREPGTVSTPRTGLGSRPRSSTTRVTVTRRIATVPFTLRNLKEDLEDVGSRFDGAPDLEFRLATDALELEQSGL